MFSAQTQAPKDVFHQGQPRKHMNTAMAVVQGGQAASRAGNRIWQHPPHGTGFEVIKKENLEAVMES